MVSLADNFPGSRSGNRENGPCRPPTSTEDHLGALQGYLDNLACLPLCDLLLVSELSFQIR